MSNTQWISVNERLPEDVSKPFLVLTDEGKTPAIARHPLRNGAWFSVVAPYFRIPNVTHWMDLPEPPAPPKPVDPFEAWWEPNKGRLAYHTTIAMSAWNAAKAHYERPLPDFEAWCKKQGRDGICVAIRLRVAIHMVRDDVARSIWNAAQGRTDG